MRSRLFILAVTLIEIAVVTAQVPDTRTTSEAGVTRRLVIDEKSVQVVRSTYLSGFVEAPGTHPFDVVLVPLTAGDIRVEVAGKAVPWKVGEPFFIPRKTEHSIANQGRVAVDLVSIRIP